MQLLLLTLDERYLLRATPPDLERGVAPLGPPVPAQPPLLGRGVLSWVKRLLKVNHNAMDVHAIPPFTPWR